MCTVYTSFEVKPKSHGRRDNGVKTHAFVEVEAQAKSVLQTTRPRLLLPRLQEDRQHDHCDCD